MMARGIAGEVDVDDRPMPALIALDVERPDAVGAHVRKVHRLDWLGAASAHSGTPQLRLPRQWREIDRSSHGRDG
jgi:hypothetical protein